MLIASLFALGGLAPPKLVHQAPGDVLRSYQSSGKFTENRGQWNSKAKFCAETGPVSVWVTTTGIVYDWHGEAEPQKLAADPLEKGKLPALPKRKDHVVAIDFVGATAQGVAQGADPLPGITNYYAGKSAQTHVKSFARAIIKDLYKGIDLVTYFDKEEQRPRYDLIVHPGANPDQIKMRYSGVKNLRVNPDGEVKYDVPGLGKTETISESRQMAYQSGDHGADFRFMPRQVMLSDGAVAFDVHGYRKDRTLVIDPLIYATYLGGSDYDQPIAVKVDANGSVYVAGTTSSFDFPVVGTNSNGAGYYNVFVAKFNVAGNCQYATLLGGEENSKAYPSGFGIDVLGNAYVDGSTSAQQFYVTDGSTANFEDSLGFLTRFDTFGAIVYSKYLGTNDSGAPFFLNGLSVGSNGTTTVCGFGGYDEYDS